MMWAQVRQKKKKEFCENEEHRAITKFSKRFMNPQWVKNYYQHDMRDQPGLAGTRTLRSTNTSRNQSLASGRHGEEHTLRRRTDHLQQ